MVNALSAAATAAAAAAAAADKPRVAAAATATAAIADAVAAYQETRQPPENRRRDGIDAEDGRADPERATNRATVTPGPARRPEPAPP